MKTADEIRAYLLANLEAMLARPSMYGTNSGLESTILDRLRDLCFVDDRTPMFDRALDDMRRRNEFLSTGVVGAFRYFHLAKTEDVTDEVASVYAAVAFRLGYFRPSRLLTSSEWNKLNERLPLWMKEDERSPADLVGTFGPPSYRSLAQRPRVFSYTVDDLDSAWVHFDFSSLRSRSKVAPLHPSMLLRDVRTGSADFSERMLFTQLGESEHASEPEFVVD